MSRSGYSDGMENWALIRWRGQVASAIRGKRGQQLFKELAEALDAMPEKKLIAHELKCEAGYCALGVVGEKRGLNLDLIDPKQPEAVAEHFNIASQLCKEIVFQNDEACQYRTPEERWQFMRTWVQDQIKK
jgi:hypothetical protein